MELGIREKCFLNDYNNGEFISKRKTFALSSHIKKQNISNIKNRYPLLKNVFATSID